MPFKRSRGYEALQPLDAEKNDDELAPEVPTTFATKGVGWSGRDGDGPEVMDTPDVIEADDSK